MTEPKKRKPLVKRKTKKAVQTKPKTETKIMEQQEAAVVEIQQKQEVSTPVEVAINPPESKPEKSAARRERIPLGTPRLKLTLPPRPGYHRRFMNDVGGRLEQAQAGGYEFVTDDGLQIGETALGSGNQDLGSRVSRIVGTMPDGKPQRAYAMEIKEEWYNEDQSEKQKRLDKIDNQIRSGTFNPDNDNDTNRYVPAEGITYK